MCLEVQKSREMELKISNKPNVGIRRTPVFNGSEYSHFGQQMDTAKSNRPISALQCLDKSDICWKVVSYLDCEDLLRVELVNRLWHTVANKQFSTLRTDARYVHLAYLAQSSYSTDRRVCCHISNLRAHGDGRVVLLGGLFGSPNTDSCILEDNATQAKGIAITNWNSRVDVGGAASVHDVNGNLLMIGGWDDGEEVALNSVCVYNFKKSRETWTNAQPINHARCFGAAGRTIQGDILHFGGGDSPYRGAECYADTFIRRVNEEEWHENTVPSMHYKRCGHSVVTTFDDSIIVLGGYNGGEDYLNTVEMLTSNLDQWISLPSMHAPRSGMAAVLGPCGSVYVAGGSPDGIVGSNTLERYDPREGKWVKLAEMHKARGYTSGCLSLHNGFYVSCGLDGEDTYHESIEHYDFRSNTWTLLEDPSTASTGQQTMTSDEVKQVWEMVTGQSSSHSAGNSTGNNGDNAALGGGTGSTSLLSMAQQAALLAGDDAFFANNDGEADGDGEGEVEEGEEQDLGSLQFEEFSVKSFEDEDEDEEEEGEGDEPNDAGSRRFDGFVTLRKSFLGRSCHTMARIL